MDPRLAKRQESQSDIVLQKMFDLPKKIDSPKIIVSPKNNDTEESEVEVLTQSSLISTESKESTVVSQSVSDSSVVRNGIESKVWNDIFNIEKVSECGKLAVEATALIELRTSLRQPLKIGDYSLKIDIRNDDRLFIPDASELKYLHIPPTISQINLDLNHGYMKEIVWGKPSDTKLDELLKWILGNRIKFMVAGEETPSDLHTDFIAYRGVLTKIMISPYENNNRWLICATKFRGTIYLCEFHESYPTPDDYFNRMSFGGFRFENYLSSYYPDIPPDPNDFDLDHHEYCCVVRSRVMSESVSHSLVFGAELDCVNPSYKEQPGTLTNFVELKTTKQMQSEHQYRNFLKYKLVKWWAQCYLVGVPVIYCGYKNNKMHVQELEPLYIEQFPDLCTEFWSPNVCLNFLNRFLAFVKECVTIDDPNVVYQFIFQPNQDISCKRLLEPGEFQILPKWFVRNFNKNTNNVH